MNNQLLKLTTYFGLLSGTFAIGGFLVYISTHYPQLSHNPVAFSAIAGLSWFALIVFILNKARPIETN